ncbi:MAG TPA: hypothetical protein VFH30_13980 [Acidimicrobiales bacterium]|nr:hypothetical protein [Acidimicrobiales bacterium]
MTKRSRIAVAGGVAAAAMLLAAPMATAAPKKGNQFSVTCPGLGTFNVVTPPGNGAFTPAFGPQSPVSIPYRTTGTVTVNGVVVEEFDNVKPAPVPSSAVTCTFEASFEDPGGNDVTIVGTALVVPRPS